MTTNDKPVCEVTARLIDLLRARDEAGRAKYGATLDRTDLTPEQWIQHAVEELLDGAGYLMALKRDLYASPQPAAPQVPERWRDVVADEYLDAIEKAGDILGQADDGETLHEACARVVAERDALLEMNAAQAATIARIQSDGLHVATLHRHPARGELRVEYTDDVTELPDGEYRIYVYKATDIRGETCNFGVESAARAWAKSGSVEAVQVRQLRAIATPPAPEQPKPECPCGESTCEEPWEPGCGLGRSEEHVRVAEQPKPAGDVEADAARYRWMKQARLSVWAELASSHGGDLDAAIDATRLSAQPAQGEGEK